jgi:PAS domain S-box-containing protein
LEKASEEIKKSEAELRTIIDAIPQLIVALGADGNFLYANQAVSEFTGLTQARLNCLSLLALSRPTRNKIRLL